MTWKWSRKGTGRADRLNGIAQASITRSATICLHTVNHRSDGSPCAHWAWPLAWPSLSAPPGSAPGLSVTSRALSPGAFHLIHCPAVTVTLEAGGAATYTHKGSPRIFSCLDFWIYSARI
jgi:hypothetical protein